MIALMHAESTFCVLCLFELKHVLNVVKLELKKLKTLGFIKKKQALLSQSN